MFERLKAQVQCEGKSEDEMMQVKWRQKRLLNESE